MVEFRWILGRNKFNFKVRVGSVSLTHTSPPAPYFDVTNSVAHAELLVDVRAAAQTNETKINEEERKIINIRHHMNEE